MRIERAGPHVSAIYFISGSGSLLRTGTRFESGTPVTLALRPGEALALIAHPERGKSTCSQRSTTHCPTDGVTLTEADLQDLCAVLDDVAGPSARLLLYRQDAAGTSDGGRRKDSLMPAGELDPIWTPEDLEFLDRMAGSPV